MYQDLPIVALTADVSGDVAHKVLEAGMNAYLTKPFVEEELYTTITQLTTQAIPQMNQTFETEHKKENRVLQQAKPINLEQVILLAAGDKLFLWEVIVACHSSLDELQTDFAIIMLTRNREALRFVKHKLKTSISMFELYQIQTILEQSVSILQQSSTTDEDLHKLVARLEKECQLVKACLAQYIDTLEQVLIFSGEGT